MDVEGKLELIKRKPTDEVITETDLKNKLETGIPLEHYIGFEISGEMHIGTALITSCKIADFQKAGMNCRIFLADWHSYINNKLDGNWNNITKAIAYYKEGFKATIKAMGGNPKKITFITGSELYNNNEEHWKRFFEISKHISLGRAKRGITIAGRKESEEVSFSQLMYMPLQVNDIFDMKLNVAHAGMDQRKGHVVAREVAPKIKREKPIAIHQHLIMGLLKPLKLPVTKDMLVDLKMSKSKPMSAVFITDSEEQIKKKINRAFCPEKETSYNPLLNWAEHLVFREDIFKVERPSKFGGNREYYSYNELETDFKKGKLHPLDLKNAMNESLVKMLKPVREHFKNKQPLIKMFEEFKITR
ncbi:MAG: tyrosine--tRNA ligase [Nanoarchaeota archaeon]|nr:tyrosine--tRNA ligase [Nanoarchaeota archaeon]